MADKSIYDVSEHELDVIAGRTRREAAQAETARKAAEVRTTEVKPENQLFSGKGETFGGEAILGNLTSTIRVTGAASELIRKNTPGSKSGFREGNVYDAGSNIGHSVGQVAANVFVPGAGDVLRGFLEPLQKSLVEKYVPEKVRKE